MKIALLGDIALLGRYSLIHNKNLFDELKSVAELLSTFDYVIGNLETPFVINHKKYNYKSAHICSEIINIDVLKFLHINCVSLANNHIFDYGKHGYKKTIEVLQENKIEFFGVEDRQVFLEKNNNKIAINGFCCYSTNPLGLNENIVNKLDFSNVLNTLEKNNKNNYNNITSIHAGEEHVNYPNIDHLKFARLLAEKIDFVYYGHHPHVLQGIEKYKNSIIAYSLGNFCFDDVYDEKGKLIVHFGENSKQSMILSLEYNENNLIKNEVFPLYDANICDDTIKEVILQNVHHYSNLLNTNPENYIKTRETDLNNYLKTKNKKDYKWLIRKMNFKSLMIVLNAFRNKKKYFKYFKSYLYRDR